MKRALCLVLFILGVAWWLNEQVEEHPPSLTSPADPGQATPAPRAGELRAPAGSDRQSSRAQEPPQQEAAPPEGAPQDSEDEIFFSFEGDPTTLALPSRSLLLDLVGPHHTEPVLVEVVALQAGGWDRVGQVLQASGRVGNRMRIEIGQLWQAGLPLNRLQVRVTHSELCAEALSVPLPVVFDPPNDSVQATLRLRPCQSIHGTVLGPDGEPRSATLGLWAMAEGRPQPRALSSVSTEADGDFSIQIDAPGQYLVTAVHADFGPAWRAFEVSLTAPHQDAGILVLDPGAELEGRFTVGGKAPLYPVSFRLTQQQAGSRMDFPQRGPRPPGALLWIDNRVERRYADRVTVVDGSFRQAGLPVGDYELHVHGFDRGHWRVERPKFQVSAPRTGLHFDLHVSIVRVTLSSTDATRPLLDGELFFERQGRDVERIPCPRGHVWGSSYAEFIVDPGETLGFEYRTPDREPVREQFLAPPTGGRREVAFSLKP